MSRKKSPVFNDKHLKALALIKEGNMTLDRVAREVGWSEDYLYDLYEGDVSKGGEVASLFSAECRKYDKESAARIKELSKKDKGLALELINEVLTDIKQKKNKSTFDKKLIATMMNAISKVTPNVEIGSVSYSLTKGYTPEQLIYEFKRLQSLAAGASNRGAVQGSFQGRSGVLPVFAGSGSEMEEEQ